MDDEHKIIISSLSREFAWDGITIQILIYRLEHDPAWQLEVVDQKGTSTVWEDLFATEQYALNEAFQTIASEGIASFLGDHDQKLHWWSPDPRPTSRQRLPAPRRRPVSCGP
jgi:hypothetical protein